VTAQPAGPKVVVVGMHRSGTSAVTGALGGLGLQMPRPGDRMSWTESNPEHWESLSLSLHDEDLLHALGGRWDAPPELPHHWVHTVQVAGGFRSAAVLARAFPDPGPSAVKDPRISLLLPHWRAVLPAPMVALLVWRDPLEVALSLERRDGLPLACGLALWERYNRAALEGLVGADTYVASYESVLADPAASLTAWASWLGSLDQFEPYQGEWDTDAAAAAITPELHHRAPPSIAEGKALLSAPQQLLYDRLAGLAGSHGQHPEVDLGVETPWATALLATRREALLGWRQAADSRQRFWAIRQQLSESRKEVAQAWADTVATRAERDEARQEGDRTAAALGDTQVALADAEDKLTHLYQSISWKATKPLRSSLAKVEQWGRRSPGPGSGH
jgi:hypothetical protein